MSQHNAEMNLAWRFISETNTSVFLTGKAGTGKTSFLRKLRELTPKRMVVLAPTGVAAINAQGQTIHSFFQLPFGPLVPGAETAERKKHFRMSQEKKDLIRTLDLLIIDEISMVRADLLDAIDAELRKYRDRYKPFGGVQLLLIGDLQQLPPVTKESEWALLAPQYQSPWFYDSHALQQLQYITIELQHIYRQQDAAFIEILAKIRDNRLDAPALQSLNARYIPDFTPPEDEDWIRLTTHNHMAQDYNDRQLVALPSALHTFKARIERTFPETNYPADPSLALKEGAQVMFIKNDPSGARAYYNGKIGIVHDITNEGIVVYSKEDDSYIGVQPVTWENTKYTLDPETQEIREEVEGTFTQYPLRLAWAITIHKSQGLTFQHAVLDINSSFAHGQVYVALSRCRTLEGLVLSRPLPPTSVITDQSIAHYINEQLTAVSPLLQQQLPLLARNYYESLLEELFDFQPLLFALQDLTRVVEEYLYAQHPLLLTRLKAAVPLAEQQLVAVSQQFRAWRQQMMAAIAHDSSPMTHAPLQQRLQAAMAYFAPKMDEILTQVLPLTSIAIDNKAVSTRYNNSLSNLRALYDLKRFLLQKLVGQPFTAALYLQTKAQGLLGAAAGSSPSPKAGNRTSPLKERTLALSGRDGGSQRGAEKAAPKPKEPARKKGDSRRRTLELFQSGLSAKQISKERDLTIQTIESHLAFYVSNGDLPLESLVTPEHQRLIREKAATFQRAYGLAELRELLPAEISYLEIRCTLAASESTSAEQPQ